MIWKYSGINAGLFGSSLSVGNDNVGRVAGLFG